uniref:Uncharacterized protein n=2 Tax=Nymphaea colorata TaxID=210225 RepID=A0A5K1DWT2_9MAGN
MEETEPRNRKCRQKEDNHISKDNMLIMKQLTRAAIHKSDRLEEATTELNEDRLPEATAKTLRGKSACRAAAE